jgi:hypothetical protein
MKPSDLQYSRLQKIIKRYVSKGRTESQAFLNWFLENIYRLDETTADDAICDDFDDKGIDAIYIDHVTEEIHFFQSRIGQNAKKTLGDTSLKEFVGSLAQFQSAANLGSLLAGNANAQVKRLVTTLKLEEYVTKGYKVVGIFVTNLDPDRNATEYLKHRADLRVYDPLTIASEYIDLDSNPGASGIAELDCYGIAPLEFTAANGSKVIISPTRASDLVKFKGIEDGSVFTQNVRLDLGKTKVNHDIESSIEDQKEHRYFPLYHNGITILCKEASHSGDKITLKDYMVVNGAQSLSALYRKRSNLSSDLKILTKIVEIKEDSDLAFKITYNSNNQNAIKPRDLKSNSLIQLRLHKEFQQLDPKKYGNNFSLEIKRGQKLEGDYVITNEYAGKLLLAFDLLEPWSCHQSYKLFDELHERIFGRPNVTAQRIVFIHTLSEAIESKLYGIKSRLFANYSLTRYFLLYVIARILQGDNKGREIYQNPSIVFDDTGGRAKLINAISNLVGDIIIDLNAEVEEMGQEFDYKNLLKSPVQVKSLADKLIATYEKLVSRGRLKGFSEDWESS